MALYEGIALIQEKQAVVLDLGYEYTKFGFTGEAAPRCIVKTEFWCPALRRYKKVYEYNSQEELYENLVHMLHLLYFRHVLVNPKERKVVVVESLFTPTEFRDTLAAVLFTHYEVSGVVWADSPRLCAYTLATPHALIVDIGAREAEVTAVVHSCVVLHSMQSQPLAAHAIHAQLRKLLDEDNGRSLNLPDHIIEDIKVRACFVRPLDRAPDAGSPRALRYAVSGEELASVTVSGRTREQAPEVLFARDNEFSALPDLVLQCIMQSPIDTRKGLAENILVVGGTANLPGLTGRLAQELRQLVTEEPYREQVHVRSFKFHASPTHASCVAWAGGALCGAAESQSRALPREQYARDPTLRDWHNLLHNTPPRHPQRDRADH